MKLNTFVKTLLVAGALTTAFACDKDKEKKELPSLDGYVKMSAPKYILQGEQLEVTPEGVQHPKGGALGYFITMSKGGKEVDRDTIKAFGDEKIRTYKYLFPLDSLGAYSLTATAFADGYTANSKTVSINLVGGLTHYEKHIINGKPVYQLRKNPAASITEHGIDLDNGKYFDVESSRYFYKELTPGLYWMQNNLMTNGGLPYENSEALSPIFGRYYNHEEALKACPKGWRLPTAAEWDQLIALTQEKIAADPKAGATVPGAWIPDAAFNSVKMWDYWPANDNGMGDFTNSMELCVLPCGYANVTSRQFDGIFLYAMFWSSDNNPDNDNQAMVYSLYNYWDTIHISMVDKASFGASVRCVREK